MHVPFFNSRRGRRVTCALLIAGALSGAAVGLAHASSPANALRFNGTQVSETQLALSGDGGGVGDQFVDHWKLQKGSSDAGTVDTTCQVVTLSDAGGTAHCVATTVLAKGQLTAQGIVPIGTQGPATEFALAVTGGTGAYKEANGVVRIRVTGEKTEVIDFDLAD